MKRLTFEQVKRQEAQSRMAAARKARRSPQAAAAQQRRASLVGDGAKWRITNFKQVARPLPIVRIGFPIVDKMKRITAL